MNASQIQIFEARLSNLESELASLEAQANPDPKKIKSLKTAVAELKADMYQAGFRSHPANEIQH